MGYPAVVVMLLMNDAFMPIVVRAVNQDCYLNLGRGKIIFFNSLLKIDDSRGGHFTLPLLPVLHPAHLSPVVH